ncbi:MAG: SH3 domain-containing protein [Lachnospiraceae bacterium]
MKNSLENKKFDFSKINIDAIMSFCKNNTKYISAGVLTVILVIALAVTAINNEKTTEKKQPKQQEEQQEESYAVNKLPTLNALVSEYYSAYTAGDVNTVATKATPVSDMEKSYIQLMSQYVESYNNIACYSKRGLDDTSYLVSVTFDMKFKGIEGTLPGLDFFYVRTNETGALYIDNLYSAFNSQMKEQTTAQEVDTLIESFQENEDVRTLQTDFQNKYTEIITADANLQNMVNTVTGAIQNWVASYSDIAAQQQAAADAAAAQAAADAAAQQAAAQAAADAAAQQAAADAAAQQAAAQQAADAAAAQAAADAAAQQAAAQPNGGINYIAEGKVLTATDGYNVRASMSETSDKIGTVAIGESVKVVLSYAEGWTKVEWKGKTGFIKTELLLNN